MIECHSQTNHILGLRVVVAVPHYYTMRGALVNGGPDAVILRNESGSLPTVSITYIHTHTRHQHHICA
jgi:hypothetical protein